MLRVTVAFCVLLALGSGAYAERRVALVIGNGTYNSQNRLTNPPNDARLIGEALAKANFETIETKVNLGIADFRQALRRFQSQANGAEVALVYFAGHGIEANGANWLIPTDAELTEDRDLDYEAVKADLVLQALQGARMRVLVLDACRDNPFGRNWRASVRGTTSGLAKLEADDVLVLFAAAPGRTASDGNGNSPFAIALAKRLPEPGLAIQLLGGNVRDDVLAATGGNQRPYVSASVTGKPFYLVPTMQPAAPTTPAGKGEPTATAPATSLSLPGTADREWQQYAKDTKDIRLLEAFKEKHKADPVYVRLAEARIEALKRQDIATAAPSPPPPAPRHEIADAAPPIDPKSSVLRSFADVVDRVKPTVVAVHAIAPPKPQDSSKRVKENKKGKSIAQPAPASAGKDSPKDPLPDLPDDHPLKEFFKNLPKEWRDLPNPTPVQGSGFVISADGYVVTNNHVIDNASKIEVSFDKDNKYEAELVGADSRTDIALLKIRGTHTFPYVKFAENLIRVGDSALAVGNPFGFGGTVSAGIVSAQGRDIGSGPYDYIQIDATVHRNSSGGPAFNLDGEVMGIITAIYSSSGGSPGITFAIPAKTASEVVAQLKSAGSVSRGWLGVKIQNIDADTAASLGMSEPKGVLVTEVNTHGPAADAGIKNGDAILTVNGTKVTDTRDLARQIATFQPNTRVNINILRGQKEQTLGLKVGQFPNGKEFAKVDGKSERADIAMDQLGLTLMAGTGADKDAVVVGEVDSASDAAQKGIKSGDVILEVGGQEVKSPDGVSSAVKEAIKLGRRAVLIRVQSGGESRFVAVQLKKG
jgi:serine protease Do